jgi:hypothetical protein
MEKTNLVTIDAKEFGIEENKAKEISAQFKPMLDKMVELEEEFNEIIKLPKDDLETSKKAKELRLKYVKVRTGTASIHKEQKAFYLQAGRFVDGWKNAQLFASQGKEQELSEIENRLENLEKERIQKLNEDRKEKMSKYMNNVELMNLGYMADDVWTAYYNAKKSAYNDRIEAEKKAEADRIKKEAKLEKERIAKEKKEEADRKRMMRENAKLKKEALAKEKRDKEEAEKREKEEEERLEKVRKEHEARLEKERKERIKREKLEAELKAKKDEEAKRQAEEEAKRQAELSKGDSDKVHDLIIDLEDLKTKYVFRSAKNKQKYLEVGYLLDKVINHIKK